MASVLGALITFVANLCLDKIRDQTEYVRKSSVERMIRNAMPAAGGAKRISPEELLAGLEDNMSDLELPDNSEDVQADRSILNFNRKIAYTYSRRDPSPTDHRRPRTAGAPSKRTRFTKEPLIPLLVGVAAASEYARSVKLLIRDEPGADLPSKFVSPSMLRRDPRFANPEIDQATTEFKDSFRTGAHSPTPCTNLICNPFREDYRKDDVLTAQCARCQLWYHPYKCQGFDEAVDVSQKDVEFLCRVCKRSQEPSEPSYHSSQGSEHSADH